MLETVETVEEIVSTPKLVDKLSKLQKIRDEFVRPLDKQINELKAELTARGLQELSDKSIKSTTFKGKSEHAHVIVTMAQEFSILNIDTLKTAITEKWHKELKPKDIDYKISTDFNKALISLFTGDYVSDEEADLKTIISGKLLINNNAIHLSPANKALLLKKLKGDYEKDKKLIEEVLGQEIDNALDEELYYIAKIKNYERIQKYFTPDELKSVQDGIRRSSYVNETLKLTLRQ